VVHDIDSLKSFEVQTFKIAHKTPDASVRRPEDIQNITLRIFGP
jgi:hypothetical protein